ncbi:MAG: TonB-dependent receptor [Pseudomonadota bacterium]
MMTRKVAFVATTALAGGLLFSSGAWAQSTGTAEVEEVVVTASSGPRNIQGVIVAERATKSRSSLTEDYIQTQAAGQTILQTINILPSVNFTNNDAYGNSGGDIVIRGFDAQRISLNVDGIQLNDTGNYQIYSNQQLDPEIISKVTTNLGTTDVDSPTASATGGTINYVTRRPDKDFGIILQPSVGDDSYYRIFGMIDSGEFGPYGTTAWFSASYTEYDKFRGPGGMEKTQYNGGLYQPLGDNGDFVGVSFNWNENRNNFYRRISVDQFNDGVVQGDNFDVCTRDTPTAGAVDNDGAGSSNDPLNTAGCNNYYNLAINPSDTGNIRGQSRFTLTEGLVLTIDPTFQYTLANGGGSTVMAETDPRLQGSFYDIGAPTATGVDLNGDGDLLDRVRLYSPSNTNTRRYSVTSSLIWDLNENNRIRAAYTFDYGRHRQTGEYSFLGANGDPRDPFSAKDGHLKPIRTLDGQVFQKRDRFSLAMLNQIAIQYVGDYFDDTVTLDLGLRAPFFQRELNNYCYQLNTFDAYCGNLTPAEADVATGSAPAPGAPTSFKRNYDKILPNLGATWRFLPGHSVYANYSENLSAPRTDDLYDRLPASPDPEISKQIDVGYRYAMGSLIFTVSGFKSDFENYIIRALTTVDGEDISTSINVGDVKRWGVDGQIGFKLFDSLTLYASASYLGSEFQDNVPGVGGGTVLIKGNQLPEVPETQYAARAQYEIAGFTVGAQVKYVGERWTNAVNDEKTSEYTTVDLDARYDLGRFGWDGSWIQLNIVNLFDEEYLADISTDIVGNRTAGLGAPRTAQVTLRTKF